MIKPFIPLLDFPGHDILTDPEKMIDYVLGYILRNPKESSELYPELQQSVGKTLSDKLDDPAQFAIELERQIQSVIHNELGLTGHDVSVTFKDNQSDKSKADIDISIISPEGKSIQYHNSINDLVKAVF